MNTFTSTELASKTKVVCDAVKEQGCAFVTNNGKATIMMIDLSEFRSINDAVHLYDRLTEEMGLEEIWRHNRDLSISEEDIETEIAAFRHEKRADSAFTVSTSADR